MRRPSPISTATTTVADPSLSRPAQGSTLGRASTGRTARTGTRRHGVRLERMMDAERIAAVLAAAERDRKELAPFTDDHPDLDEATAYAAQWAGVQAKLAAGERLVGAKLGLTSKVKQRVMKVDAPLYGWVTSGMLGGYGEPVDLARFIHPRVEPEIAFLLGHDVSTPATVPSVLAPPQSGFAAVDPLRPRDADFRVAPPALIAGQP